MLKNSISKLLGSNESKMIIILLLIGYLISIKNYLLFHTLIETITLSIGFSIMLIIIGIIKICENKHFIYLGTIYGFVGIIDLFHIVTYKGINVVSDNFNIPIQLLIAGRYYEAIALLFSFYYINRKFDLKKLLITNSIIVCSIFISIFIIRNFPDCYIEGYGFTKFKIYSEIIISGIFFAFILLIQYYDNYKISSENRNLILSVIFKILAEISFAFYTEVYHFFNYVGHGMKFIAAYFLFKALFSSVITNPYNLIFRDLHRKNLDIQKKNKELISANNKFEKEYLKYQRLIEFLPDGMLVTQDSIVTYANNKFASMFNLKDKRIILNRNVVDFFDPESKNKLIKILKDENKTRNQIECKLNFNGIEIETEISTLYLKDDDEKDFSISIIRDISDRKKAMEMEALLIQREKEDKLKNDFFDNISHELKTPINLIYSAVQVESLYLSKKDLGAIINYNNIIKQNCLRLIRLTNNIIDTTKIKSGFFHVKLKVRNIVTIIEEATLSITSYSDCRNMKVTFDTEYEEIFVKCDKNLIERIILNLLSNSVKYGRDGGTIDVSIYKKDQHWIEIAVKDDGIGIPEESQRQIFEIFEKVDKSRSRIAEGSGMGLYLVKELIGMHNGVIWMNSEMDKGTEFLVNLPIARENNIYDIHKDINHKTSSDIMGKIDIEFSDIYI